MKRKDLVAKLCEHGFVLLRNGANHDIYFDGKKMIPVERHREIPENTARAVLKEAGIKKQ